MRQLHVLAGAGVENSPVQPTPGSIDTLGGLAYGVNVGQIGGDHQELIGVAFGQRQQWFAAARGQCYPVALFSQLLSQCQADAAGSAGQPDSALMVHVSRLLSKRMTLPSSGMCSYSRAPAS